MNTENELNERAHINLWTTMEKKEMMNILKKEFGINWSSDIRGFIDERIEQLMLKLEKKQGLNDLKKKINSK